MPRRKSIIDTASVEAVSRASTPPELQDPVEIEDIQIVPMERMAAKVAAEKFMNEKIEIEIEPGTEPNDPVYVELGHNGIAQMVKRGTVQTVKRKFLYSALMAKLVKLNVSFGKDNNGNEFNRDTRSVSTAYRARLVSDPNPAGGSRWVQAVMAESAG
jgi:hypothetical protein